MIQCIRLQCPLEHSLGPSAYLQLNFLLKNTHFVNLGFSFLAGISSGKPANHERKNTLTPTQRESVPAKSPVPGADPVVTHSPFDPHHRGATPEVYRSHLPPHLDPAMPFHRALDPGNYPCVGFLKF